MPRCVIARSRIHFYNVYLQNFLGVSKSEWNRKNLIITPGWRDPDDSFRLNKTPPPRKHSSCPFTLIFKVGIINHVFTDEENEANLWNNFPNTREILGSGEGLNRCLEEFRNTCFSCNIISKDVQRDDCLEQIIALRKLPMERHQ